MTRLRCPVCEGEETMRFLELEQVPVNCNVLWPTAVAAKAAPLGDIRLRFCRRCGHVYNDAFEPALTAYEVGYENSLHFSPRFQEYARELAEHLAERYKLRGGSVVEIGCGKGEFLELLCETADATGLGFDPTYEPHDGSGDRIRVIRDVYSEAYSQQLADLIVCRHTLEHIPEPREFLASVRRTLGSRIDVGVYFEVPNALCMLRDLGIWDIIYEHCSYFTPSSLRWLFQEGGFIVEGLTPAFGEQFLNLEALPRVTAYSPEFGRESEVRALDKSVRVFGGAYRSQVDFWGERLTSWNDRGDRVALWGAGSKGVTFLNVVPGAEMIAFVVDVNPRKSGRCVAGTGQKVMPPTSLAKHSPAVVVVMNPLYQAEIQRMLEELSVVTEVVVVSELT